MVAQATAFVRIKSGGGNAAIPVTVAPRAHLTGQNRMSKVEYVITPRGTEVPTGVVPYILDGRSYLEAFSPDPDTLKMIRGELERAPSVRIRARTQIGFHYPSGQDAIAMGAPGPCRITIGPEWSEVNQCVADYVLHRYSTGLGIEVEPISEKVEV